jgi:hypothetical protein
MMARPRTATPSPSTLRSRRQADRERRGVRVIGVEIGADEIDRLESLGLVSETPDEEEIGLAIKNLVKRTRPK